MRCFYCGIGDDETKIVSDHFIPKVAGGADGRGNRVPACVRCNGIKRDLPLDHARIRLLQRRLGWPAFTDRQLAWLRAAGFDMSLLDNAVLYYEESGAPLPKPAMKKPKPGKRRAAIRRALRDLAFDESSRRLIDLGLPKHMRKVIWGDHSVRCEIPSAVTN